MACRSFAALAGFSMTHFSQHSINPRFLFSTAESLLAVALKICQFARPAVPSGQFSIASWICPRQQFFCCFSTSSEVVAFSFARGSSRNSSRFSLLGKNLSFDFGFLKGRSWQKGKKSCLMWRSRYHSLKKTKRAHSLALERAKRQRRSSTAHLR